MRRTGGLQARVRDKISLTLKGLNYKRRIGKEPQLNIYVDTGVKYTMSLLFALTTKALNLYLSRLKGEL